MPIQKILKIILRSMSWLVLKRYHPKIVGITGSVGKTSAKEAIYTVLKDNFSVWKGTQNFNNEIGVPLTILGINYNISFFNFFLIFFKWFLMLIWWPYPQILILEMAVDHPGDMDYFLKFIKINIAVLTDISNSHLKFFRSKKQLTKEKTKIVYSTLSKKNGQIILNVDNKIINKILKEISLKKLNAKEKMDLEKRIITYGIKNQAKLRATDIHLHVFNRNIQGLSFKLNYEDKIIPVRLNHIIASHQIYAVLAGIAVGISLDVDLMNIITVLENFSSPSGRMKLMKGKNSVTIIDDSYNASPISVLAALETLNKIPSHRKVVILGDMLELGKISQQEHQKVLFRAKKLNLDLILLVGKRMKLASRNVFQDDDGSVFVFKNVDELNQKIENIIHMNDLVLIKGSRAMQLDKTVQLLTVDNFS